MESGWDLWVWLVGMISRRWVWLVGGTSGWNLWVWLECIGVVSGCCCKKISRFPHNITYPYST